MHSDLTWRRLIFGMSDGELRFSFQAITNMTPTPDNLRRWGNSEIDSACSICGQTCTLQHVFNACKVSLLQGRYLWRHNLILGCLQKYLLDFWSSVKKENCAATAPFIRLVPEGTKAINLPSSRQTWRPQVSNDLLRCGNDWVFLFDLETGLVFPPEIGSTTQRPDIVIYSKSKKIVVLTNVPLEDRISTAHELKNDRYLEDILGRISSVRHSVFQIRLDYRNKVQSSYRWSELSKSSPEGTSFFWASLSKQHQRGHSRRVYRPQ